MADLNIWFSTGDPRGNSPQQWMQSRSLEYTVSVQAWALCFHIFFNRYSKDSFSEENSMQWRENTERSTHSHNHQPGHWSANSVCLHRTHETGACRAGSHSTAVSPSLRRAGCEWEKPHCTCHPSTAEALVTPNRLRAVVPDSQFQHHSALSGAAGSHMEGSAFSSCKRLVWKSSFIKNKFIFFNYATFWALLVSEPKHNGGTVFPFWDHQWKITIRIIF